MKQNLKASVTKIAPPPELKKFEQGDRNDDYDAEKTSHHPSPHHGTNMLAGQNGSRNTNNLENTDDAI